MSAKTKIVVLHMKEVIYTGIFAVLGIILIILLAVMLLPKGDTSVPEENIPETIAPNQDTTETPFGLSSTEERSLSLTEPREAADQSVASASVYIPGIYTTEILLGNQTINVETIVDSYSINSIRLLDLSDSVTAMYPLLQPAFDDLCEQIMEKQSPEGVVYSTENKYTSLVLLEAIENSLDKARTSSKTIWDAE